MRERTAEHMAATRDAGANFHLAKPIRPDGLVEVLVDILAAAAARDDVQAVAI